MTTRLTERILEPEIMDEPSEVDAYDKMDHRQVNQRFVLDLMNSGPVAGTVLDVGTGTARIPILLIETATSVARCIACDASPNMLAVAHQNVDEAGLSDRIQLRCEDSKKLTFADAQFDCVISNSLFHHLPDPRLALTEIVRVTRANGRLFVRDLFRPETTEDVERLVLLHAANEPVWSQQLFAQSLCAALSLDEVQSLVAELGFDRNSVQATSNRHWTWDAKKSIDRA